MYFEQFYLGCLAHASYMLGSEGEAAVVDPQRDVEIYLKAADQQGLKIRHIFETHLHADFVSGHLELAKRTGAKIYIGAQAGATFPHVALHDGSEVRFGKLLHYARWKRPAILLKVFAWWLPMKKSPVIRGRCSPVTPCLSAT